MNTEIEEHLAQLISEYQMDIYLSGPVEIAAHATVLDVGANIGLFAKNAIAAGAQRVVCFQPAPGNLRAFLGICPAGDRVF